MKHDTLAVSAQHGESGTVWTLADDDGPIDSTRERSTAAAWRHFLGRAEPLTPAEFNLRFPRAECDKLVGVAVVCKDGFIRRR